MEEMRRKIGQNLRGLILEQHSTVEQFCHIHGFDKTWIGRILKGERDPQLTNAIKIAEALGCTLNDIYPGPTHAPRK
jgi:transcriptional regulator with XRE-family HTH domain